MEFCDTANWKSALRPAGSGYVTEWRSVPLVKKTVSNRQNYEENESLVRLGGRCRHAVLGGQQWAGTK
jgi:hypothetical protein